ncbi:MAG: outer membrane lipoprotein [Gammaproteobacteria bacterium]|nr:MAG: outer membrane lipoprotein [Gammaproteobacteria bacterium]TND04320.1 MAG: outer membrane lipoprotein [Gammaproteobacteria bacterium]
MKANRIKFAVAASLLALPAVVFAGDRGHNQYDKAKVINAEPIMRTVQVSTPRRDCWDEEVTHDHYYESATPAIFGGIVGGVIGHQFGGGNGKKAATVAGTLLGASIGRDGSRQTAYARPHTETQRHCQVSDDSYVEERVTGYHVTYRYRGEVFETRMDHDPGAWVKVKMRVDVID